MDEDRRFKNHIDATVVRYYAQGLASRISGFDARAYERAALDGLDDLELKARVKHLAASVHQQVGGHYEVGLGGLVGMLDDKAATEGASVEFRHWPMAQYVEDYGIEHVDASIAAMKRITGFFSCEFAVRPFLVRYPERMMATIHAWAADPDVNVRRNASEGIRPRLPWGVRLDAFIDDPRPVFEVLERLHDDPEEYVRRSVSNCLNDIAKDHPDAVMDVVERWDRSPGPHTEWVKGRALRTLIKAANPRALGLMGFGPAKVRVEDFRLDAAAYVVGDSLQMTLTLVSTAEQGQDLLVDYRVHYVKANGATRPKVFKWATPTLGPGASLTLVKKQHLRRISTRRYYAGAHKVDVQVNGAVLAEVAFDLAID